MVLIELRLYDMNVVRLNKEHNKTSTVKMPNNLDAMIRRSGLLNREVAERKGIRPETVSRHISGALQFTLKDAEEYAVILGCTAQDVLFVQNAVPLFGTLNEDIVTVRSNTDKQIAYYVPYPLSDDKRIVLAEHQRQNKRWANGRMYIFSNLCIEKQAVDEACFMRLSIMMIRDNPHIRFGVAYPEPGGTFSVGFNSDTHTTTDQGKSKQLSDNDVKRGVDLVWATPILSCIMQPDLLDIVEKK